MRSLIETSFSHLGLEKHALTGRDGYIIEVPIPRKDPFIRGESSNIGPWSESNPKTVDSRLSQTPFPYPKQQVNRYGMRDRREVLGIRRRNIFQAVCKKFEGSSSVFSRSQLLNILEELHLGSRSGKLSRHISILWPISFAEGVKNLRSTRGGGLASKNGFLFSRFKTLIKSEGSDETCLILMHSCEFGIHQHLNAPRNVDLMEVEREIDGER